MGRISLILSTVAVIGILSLSAGIVNSVREDILVSSRESLGPSAYAALSANILDVNLVFGIILGIIMLFGAYAFLKHDQIAARNEPLA